MTEKEHCHKHRSLVISKNRKNIFSAALLLTIGQASALGALSGNLKELTPKDICAPQVYLFVDEEEWKVESKNLTELAMQEDNLYGTNFGKNSPKECRILPQITIEAGKLSNSSYIYTYKLKLTSFESKLLLADGKEVDIYGSAIYGVDGVGIASSIIKLVDAYKISVKVLFKELVSDWRETH